MYALLKTEKDDTNKVSTLVSLGYQILYKGNYHVGDSLSEIALNLAHQLNYKRGIARSQRNIGLIHCRQGDIKQANDCYDEALQLYRQMNDRTGQAAVLNSLGNMYDQKGDYQKALDYFYQVRDLFTQLGNKQGIAIASNNMGLIYLKQGNNPKALDNFLKALEMFHSLGQKNFEMEMKENIGIIYDNQGEDEKALSTDKEVLQMAQDIGDTRTQANVLDNMGDLFAKQHKYDEALKYCSDGLRLHENNGEKMEVVSSLNGVGAIESNMHNYDTAAVVLNRALALGEAIDFPEGIATASISLAAIDTVKKNYTAAMEHAQQALALGKKTGGKQLIKDAEEMLSLIYGHRGNYPAALAHYKAYITARDSIYSEENTKKIVAEEMNYEFDKKEATQKADQEKKDALAEQDRKKQAIIRNSFIVGFLLMIALAFFIFRGYSEKKKANIIISAQKAEVEQQKLLVEHQKAIVEEKNKDITDSIHYASRIQRALLTTDEYMGKHLPEYFILFKPRDIVSGDFYWAYKAPLGKEKQHQKSPTDGEDLGDVFYLACCDCTGHGVPGAFMSLLNISMLNEAVIERKITQPDKVFNDIRQNIIKALNPKGLDSESKDGMDGILAALKTGENNTVELTYTAAYNAPIIIKKGGELVELTANKMPVGAQHGAQKPFTLQKATLQKGDSLYLFTDGYADQFGGDKGKKFKHRQLLEKLSAINHEPMTVQKQILDTTIEAWKGNLEQVDDILIIGIRV